MEKLNKHWIFNAGVMLCIPKFLIYFAEAKALMSACELMAQDYITARLHVRNIAKIGSHLKNLNKPRKGPIILG